MESRFLDRLAFKPTASGRQSLHPLLLAAYGEQAIYSEAIFRTDLVVTYHPTVGSDHPGTIHFGYSAEPVPALPAQVAALSPSATTASWKPATITVPRKLLNTKAWLRIGDDPGYLIWVFPEVVPGYFTLTATIKSIGPISTELQPSPDPESFPVTTYRGTRAPSLFKYGFTAFQPSTSSSSTVFIKTNMAFCCGGRPRMDALSQLSPGFDNDGNPRSYACDAQSPWMYNFNQVFPGHRVLCILCPSRALTNNTTGGTDPEFYKWLTPTPTIEWTNFDLLQATFPGGADSLDQSYRLGWFLFDYPFDDFTFPPADSYRIFLQPIPAPIAMMILYYAIPPGMVLMSGINQPTQGLQYPGPAILANSNLNQDADPLHCPIWTAVQNGTFNPSRGGR